ncbi:SUMF1/EgtB/PvdO family nonheme iron enzyme [Anabaena sp. FACHB-1250]|uniref:SUMF1/EgtB/PvdO family nonheme iron enzyme n=1 Tax=Anabaena sp. FACHB-1250 TaxID=2692770 RepID=UPI0016803C69|nr:SUMF1/EgtB/PvdO family nonheme iron enzyme [Anabaena sp. FACHB-1250]
MNHPQQPREYDAVLGGNSPSLEGAAVLGGIEGVKLRLQNPDAKVRIAALEQAVNYGEQGLDLVIAGLKDESWDIQNAAYLILSDKTEPRIKQILQDPYKLGFKLEQIEVVTVDDEDNEFDDEFDDFIFKSDKVGEFQYEIGEYQFIIHRQPRIARYFMEYLGNGVTLEMAAIPGGTFMMGSPENEEGRRDSENPQHQVTVPGFFMGKYPVTQAQYQAIMGTNPSFFKGSNRPVESVSWHDAVKFCEKLSQRTGKTYRLPSEAEWEYACRAGTTTPFHFGKTITTHLANYNYDNGNHSYTYGVGNDSYIYGFGIEGITTVVGSFGVANNFGLYDMHGNVSEWCQDNWHSNYKGAPTDGSAWLNNISSSDEYLMRGGSCLFGSLTCRSACRYDDYLADDGSFYIGFRVVCSGAART